MEEKTMLETWLYFPDRPVGLSGDRLWREQSATRQQIKEIALRIIAPLSDNARYPGYLSDSITFAIHGGWGSGKSSVLRMIKEEVQHLARDHRLEERLKFCDYVASAHEGVGEDVRTTMAMRLLLALAEDDGSEEGLTPADRASRARERAVRWFGQHTTVLPQKRDTAATSPAEPDDRTRATAAAGKLEELSETLAQLVDFDHLLTRELSGQGESNPGVQQVMVALIDDLDRCKPEFVSDVLDTLQQWSAVPNLFFILAIDQQALRRAVEQKTKEIAAGGDPYYALEKYVQHTVSVPPMDDERLAAFVGELLSGYKDPVSHAIADEVIYLQRGLQIKTPRAVKRCLNTIRPDIQQRLTEADLASAQHREERQRIVKERVLEYSWRDFYNTYFVPAVRYARRPHRPAFAALEKVCADFEAGGTDEEWLEFEIGRIRRRLSDEHFAVPLELAHYLALPPYWIVSRPEPAKDAISTKVAISTADLLRGVMPVEERRVSFLDEGEDIQEQFIQLYLRSETADSEGNRAEALRLVEQLYRLVNENREHFGPDACATVGNAAVTAEKYKANNLARALYELAAALDPEHSNNLQNFVDFIVGAPLPELFPTAVELLAKLETGKHAAHRPERTLLLKARLAQRMEQPEPTRADGPGLREQLIRTFEAEPTDRQRFAELVRFLAEVGDYENMRQVCQTYYDHAESEEGRYLGKRILADMLADSPDEHNERQAMDIYREFYEQGVERGRVDYMHNYATLLYKHDYDDVAGRVWFEAYNLRPMDASIRRSYSMYLLRAERPDLAQKVGAGEAISEMVLQPRIKEKQDRYASEPAG